MGILRLHRDPRKGLDLTICAAFLGLAAFWTAVGIALVRLL
jgi:hypothetical protein